MRLAASLAEAGLFDRLAEQGSRLVRFGRILNVQPDLAARPENAFDLT
ncbi:hypothetical protein ACVW0J_007396 [Bradyrhizobium sp. i1.7.7]